tara:strand:+ start:240 stop:1100 length:861 start_codon:yes stop_codon:yes gene_type:complete
MSLRAAARLLPSIMQTGTKFGPRMAAVAAGPLQGAAQFLGNPLGRSLIGGTIGAATNQDGTLGGRIRGGLLGGALGTLPLGLPGTGALQSAGASQLMKLGVNPNVAQNILQTVVPLGLLGVGANQGTGGLGGSAVRAVTGQRGMPGIPGQMGNNAVGLLGYHAVTGEPLYGTPVPPNVGPYGGIPPVGGSALDVLQAGGPAGAQRLTTLKNAQTMADALNAYMPTVRKFSEQAKKDDFERNMAAAGIKQNILTNAQMLANAQLAGLNMGTTGAQQAGQALTTQYNY